MAHIEDVSNIQNAVLLDVFIFNFLGFYWILSITQSSNVKVEQFIRKTNKCMFPYNFGLLFNKDSFL